jgi:hypothetical protein
VSPSEANRLAKKLQDHIEETNAQPDDQCPSSKAVYGITDFDALLEALTPAVSEAAGKRLVPTYSYARMYVTGEILAKHTDRSACQYSVTLCLGMDSQPWPIFMATVADAASGAPFETVGGKTMYMGEPSSVSLGVGDGVLYLGMDMVHYREAFEGQWQAQVFLHWVDADGPYADQKYDGRDGLGHHQDQNPYVEELVSEAPHKNTEDCLLEILVDQQGEGARSPWVDWSEEDEAAFNDAIQSELVAKGMTEGGV